MTTNGAISFAIRDRGKPLRRWPCGGCRDPLWVERIRRNSPCASGAVGMHVRRSALRSASRRSDRRRAFGPVRPLRVATSGQPPACVGVLGATTRSLHRRPRSSRGHPRTAKARLRPQPPAWPEPFSGDSGGCGPACRLGHPFPKNEPQAACRNLGQSHPASAACSGKRRATGAGSGTPSCLGLASRSFRAEGGEPAALRALGEEVDLRGVTLDAGHGSRETLPAQHGTATLATIQRNAGTTYDLIAGDAHWAGHRELAAAARPAAGVPHPAPDEGPGGGRLRCRRWRGS